MTNEKLIAEARRALVVDDQERNRYGETNAYPRSGMAELASRLADALEASVARVKELEAQVKDFKCEQVFRISEMQELLEAQHRISELEAKLAARQPSEDGKYILRLIETIKQTGGSVEVAGVKIMPCDEFGRTAAVPDAATAESERRAWAIAGHLERDREAVKAERDAALARIAEVAKLHRKRKYWETDKSYIFVCGRCRHPWPCDDARILGLNEGESDDQPA